MLAPEVKQQRDAERSALSAWLAGDQAEPFALEHHEAYCVCDVLWPSWLHRIRVQLRSLAVGIIARLPGSALKVLCYRLLGAGIGRGVTICPGVVIDPFFPWLVELEDDCLLGMGCRLFAHEYTATGFRIGRVRVGKGSVIGAYATVRGGVSVGRKATVGFNSYVNRDVGDGETVGGVPARPLRSRREDE